MLTISSAPSFPALTLTLALPTSGRLPSLSPAAAHCLIPRLGALTFASTPPSPLSASPTGGTGLATGTTSLCNGRPAARCCRASTSLPI